MEMDQGTYVMAGKRSALTAENLVVPKQDQAEDAPAATTSTRRTTASAGMAITSIHLPRELLTLLRFASINRADRHGGRPSVSDVIRDWLERHRDEIEDETGL